MAILPIHLRLEITTGSAKEYRIRDEMIETRQLYSPSGNESEWHRLTPEQLSDHVNRNTVVAQWLERRLGWRQLLRACVGEQNLCCFGTAENTAEPRAA